MKTFLTSLFILAVIFVFAGSGPAEEFNTDINSKMDFRHYKKQLPEKADQLFAINTAPAVYTPAPVKPAVSESPGSEVASKEKATGKDRIRIYPNAREGELWVETEADTKGLDLQIYNSSGQAVYKSKLESSFHKVDLCNYVNGKYLIKVGGQTYQLMLIQ